MHESARPWGIRGFVAPFVDGRPAQAVKYYLVAGQRIASWAGSTGTVTYYTHDHLGSTVRSSAGESIRYLALRRHAQRGYRHGVSVHGSAARGGAGVVLLSGTVV